MVNKISSILPTNKFKNLMNSDNLTSKNKKILIFGIAAIGLIILFVVIYRYRQIQKTKRLNPVFIAKGKKANKKYIISGSKLAQPSNGYDMSVTFWIYINSWKYRKGSWKHILHKGKNNTHHLSTPGVFLLPNKNDLRIQLATRLRGNQKNNYYYPI